MAVLVGYRLTSLIFQCRGANSSTANRLRSARFDWLVPLKSSNVVRDVGVRWHCAMLATAQTSCETSVYKVAEDAKLVR